ncbi:MAG: hypothetical protein ACKPH1_17660, partial [Microcystis panniformis]
MSGGLGGSHPTPHTPHPPPCPQEKLFQQTLFKTPQARSPESLKDHFGNHTLNCPEARART